MNKEAGYGTFGIVFPSMREALDQKSSTAWDQFSGSGAETAVQGYSQLRSEFEASLGTRPCLKRGDKKVN